ncbi:hypothetical protein [Lentzea sp. NPDC059081]|uniref:hypothetical protein n=1 Tax=Lentzea sp. NPDC059081 TaxID=3346719 RepID=UPI0036906A70
MRAAKWFTLGATYVMNTWSAFVAGSAALVVLHSVPPLVVFVAAEAVTDLRDSLGTAAGATVEAVAPAPRTSFAEYMAVARKARKSSAKVSPAWVREVTGCSRGLSSKLAAELNGDQR